jgi:hypothetical protein
MLRMRAMAKKPTPKAGTKRTKPPTSDEFSEAIVVPFRGMPRDPTSDPSGKAPSVEDLMRDAAARQIEKLNRLAVYHGIDMSSPYGWPLLALQLANSSHPGFRLVYDDWQARYFHSLYGFTPLFPLKARSPGAISRSAKGWRSASKLLRPEFLALMVHRARNCNLSDEKICEIIVKSADEEMKLRKNQPERMRRTATLVRRLSKGRKLLGKQRPATGKKTGV